MNNYSSPLKTGGGQITVTKTAVIYHETDLSLRGSAVFLAYFC